LEVPTSVVYASSAPEAMDRCAAAFESSYYRVSRTSDIVGVEICAVLKNVYAIGIGFCDGISENRGSTMNNTKAALFTSTLSEMKCFVKAAGGEENTVYGLAGIGDLNVTCLGGRNSQLGRLIGSGLSPEDALSGMKAKGLTVEGYSSTEKLLDLATQLEREGNLEVNADLPVLLGICEVLYKGRNPREIVGELI